MTVLTMEVLRRVIDIINIASHGAAASIMEEANTLAVGWLLWMMMSTRKIYLVMVQTCAMGPVS